MRWWYIHFSVLWVLNLIEVKAKNCVGRNWPKRNKWWNPRNWGTPSNFIKSKTQLCRGTKRIVGITAWMEEGNNCHSLLLLFCVSKKNLLLSVSLHARKKVFLLLQLLFNYIESYSALCFYRIYIRPNAHTAKNYESEKMRIFDKVVILADLPFYYGNKSRDIKEMKKNLPTKY